MCSVVGYIGKQYSRALVLEGLARLEYRGYDSAGFACVQAEESALVCRKAAGQLSNLVQKLEQMPIDGFAGIGHTRWSTHGVSSEQNAHPHVDCHHKIAVVHNGIIENYRVLRQHLHSSHQFRSETDTEVIAHQLEHLLRHHATVQEAAFALAGSLEGAYAVVALMHEHPDTMLLIRRRSPLSIGLAEGEAFVASDHLAFAGRAQRVLFMPDESIAFVRKGAVSLYDFAGKALPLDLHEMKAVWQEQSSHQYAHYMLKEIYEQKQAIKRTVEGLKSLGDNVWQAMGQSADSIKKLDTLQLLGCGTSWHASRIAQFFFEQVCMLPTRVHLASEFRHHQLFVRPAHLYMFVSQSGETADALEALRLVKSGNAPTVALTNVATSTMVREADGALLTHAGPEVAVGSTKAFSTQLTAFYWLAHRMALEKGVIDEHGLAQAEHDLLMVAQILEDTIERYKTDITTMLAPYYAKYTRAICLGRHISYPFALEAALKLKEIPYIFSQCYPSGELKHGPLALLDGETPVFVFSHQDETIYQKLVSNVQEVKARGGHVLAFAFEGQAELIDIADNAFVFPRINPLLGPLAMTGVMQFFVYAVANHLKRPIDKPRNLAKSVTVE